MRYALLLLLIACASTPAPEPGPLIVSEERHTDVPLFKAGGEMQPPKVIKRVEPILPDSLRKSIQRSSVTMHLLIDEQGIVRDAWLVGGDPRLAKMARDAFMQWRFTPATLDGKPIAVRAEEGMTVSVSHTVFAH
jgi:hypothetical protein